MAGIIGHIILLQKEAVMHEMEVYKKIDDQLDDLREMTEEKKELLSSSKECLELDELLELYQEVDDFHSLSQLLLVTEREK